MPIHGDDVIMTMPRGKAANATIREMTAAIDSVFKEFKIDAYVVGNTVGPSVTRYEVALGPGVKVEKIPALQGNLAYACASRSVRIQAPIPGRSLVGIELPKTSRDVVKLPPVHGDPLTIFVGESVDGEAITASLKDMPHLLVAGATGSGKSCFINSTLVTLIARNPDEVQLLLIDPKMVELTPYNGIAHLVRPVVTEPEEAIEALEWLIQEMEERYKALQGARKRNVTGLGYPYIVCVIDELADLIMTTRVVESHIARLTAKGRAAGIHLILATQRPSVDVVTGLIKSNVPSRLAFATASSIDSRVILDENGAEQLLGKGDGLFNLVGSNETMRIQGAYVSEADVDAAVELCDRIEDVENMADALSAEPEGMRPVDYINEVIRDLDKAWRRAGGVVEDFVEKKTYLKSAREKEDKRRQGVLFKMPGELGLAADELRDACNALKHLIDVASKQA